MNGDGSDNTNENSGIFAIIQIVLAADLKVMQKFKLPRQIPPVCYCGYWLSKEY